MTFFDRLLSRIKNERGAYMVFFAILIPILFACAGLAVDLGNGFARHARLQKAADAAVLAASYVYDENNSAEMYRVAEQYLQANLDNEEDRRLSLDEIRKKYDMKLYDRGPQDSTKTEGRLLTLDATEKIGAKFIEFVGIHGFSVDVRATTKVVVKKSVDSGVFGYSFICGDDRTASESGNVWDSEEKKPPFIITQTTHKIVGKVHTNGAIGINGSQEVYSGLVKSGDFTTSIKSDEELWKSRGEANWAHLNGGLLNAYYANDKQINGTWYHFNRFGYYDKAGAADVRAQDCQSEELKISLSKTNDKTNKTKAIYDYVEDMRANHTSDQDVHINVNAKYDQDITYSPWDMGEWVPLGKYKVIISDGPLNIGEDSSIKLDDSKQPMVIISLHGNVMIGTNQPIKALIYAPNGRVSFTGAAVSDDSKFSFEGSIVGKQITLNSQNNPGKYVSYKWNDFNFGTADFGKPNSGSGGSGTGGGDSGTASVSSVILHKNKDADYEEPSSQNELRP